MAWGGRWKVELEGIQGHGSVYAKSYEGILFNFSNRVFLDLTDGNRLQIRRFEKTS